MNAIDRLMDLIEEKQNPTVLGLDTRIEYLPDEWHIVDHFEQHFRDNCWVHEQTKYPHNADKHAILASYTQIDPTLSSQMQIPKSGPLTKESGLVSVCATYIFRYNMQLIDALCDIIPAVKLQIAYYEMYGEDGIAVFDQTAQYAREKGMFVIADAKRGDIGATAEAYAAAFLGKTSVNPYSFQALPCDMVTVNPYFGTDGILPFTEQCQENDKGIFVLVKTSNPSGSEIQDLISEGKPIYEHICERVAQWGQPLMGRRNYSAVGAVVGATYPEQGAYLRRKFPQIYFLVPGYGAQGATANDLAGCFDGKGHGAVVNASRSLMCAGKKYSGMDPVEASRKEALRMKEDILQAIGGKVGS